MAGRRLVPGDVWSLRYNGPQTHWPTYLAAVIHQRRDSVDARRWVVIDVGRDVVLAADGDYAAARRALGPAGVGSGHVGRVLVAVDTRMGGRSPDGNGDHHVYATVLHADGEWMLWHDAQGWELSGLGELQDAVQAAVSKWADRRAKAAARQSAAPADRQQQTAAERQRAQAERDAALLAPGGLVDQLDAGGAWGCDDCGEINPAAEARCSRCGLARDPELTPLEPAAVPELPEVGPPPAVVAVPAHCGVCGLYFAAAGDMTCPACGAPYVVPAGPADAN